MAEHVKKEAQAVTAEVLVGAEAVPEAVIVGAPVVKAVVEGAWPAKPAERRRPGFTARSYQDEEREPWIPKTAIGKKVQAGEITNIDDLLDANIPIMEAGIVDVLLPGLGEEVINVRRVQRTLDSGRRMRFSILAVVGDKNGHMGVGMAKGVEAGPTIKRAMIRAKLNIIKVKRGCASWECGCGEAHTVPFKVIGRSGSVAMTLKPAPRGVGLVTGDNSKAVLTFAGIQDVWTFSKGHGRTVTNQVLAIYDALKQLSNVKTDAKSSHKVHKETAELPKEHKDHKEISEKESEA